MTYVALADNINTICSKGVQEMYANKWKFMTVFLALILIILSWRFFHLSIRNGKNLKIIHELSEQLNGKGTKLMEKNTEFNNSDFLNYIDRATRNRFPLFSKIVEVVYNKSKHYGFDPNVILGLIHIESNFRPYAISSKGAYGLMQVNYSIWKDELDIDNLRIFDIEYNIDLGLKILKHYYEKSSGNMLGALHLYNNGYLYKNHKYKHQVISSIFY